MSVPAPFQDRRAIRLVLIREAALPAGARRRSATTADATLKFDRLAHHVAAAGRDLPRCVHAREVDPSGVAADGPVLRAYESVWVLSAIDAAFVMQTLDVPADSTPRQVVDQLEAMYEGVDLSAGRPDGLGDLRAEVPEKQHQMVFLPVSHGAVDFDELQRYVYRADMPAVEAHSVIRYPGELNRREGKGAGCGPFVSVMWGQQDYIENCAVISAMLALGAAGTIRDVQSTVLRMFEQLEAGEGDVQAMPLAEARGFVNGMEESLASLRTRLVLGLDSVSTLMPWIPSLRPESFHLALFGAMDVDANRVRLERIVSRLAAVIGAQAEVVARLTASRAESRARRWSTTLSFASVLAVPFGILFGFFGMSAVEIDGARSFLDVRFYWPVYAGVAVLVLATVGLHLALLARERSRLRHGRVEARLVAAGEASAR